MRKYTYLPIALGALLTLNSCGDEKKANTSEGTDMHMNDHSESAEVTDLDDGEVAAAPEFKDDRLAAVYEDYLQLKSDLVNTDAEESKSSGEELVSSLEQAEAGEAALEAARNIAGSGDIKEQRNAFSDLSAAVETLLAGNLVSGEVYKQYCPMAFDGAGGYWLSNSEEVRNPYYGDMMLKCGRVSDTIK